MKNSLLATTLVLSLGACSTYQNTNPTVYDTGRVFSQNSNQTGTVQSIQFVTIEPQTTSGVGQAIGGLGGVAAGGQVGGGRGRTISQGIGGVIGSVVGDRIERKVMATPGYLVTVKMDKGGSQSYIQDKSIPLYAGQRVQIVGGYSDARVFPIN